MTTRRLFMMSAGSAVMLAAQTQKADTFVTIIPDDFRGGFGVGVRSSFRCDWYRVEVFYHRKVEGIDNPLLVAEESLAIGLAGPDAWGQTNRNFKIPVDQIQYVQVTFLRALGQRKIDKNEVE